jgi:hypothetical protein
MFIPDAAASMSARPDAEPLLQLKYYVSTDARQESCLASGAFS